MALRNLWIFTYLLQQKLTYYLCDDLSVENRRRVPILFILKESFEVFQPKSMLFFIMSFPIFHFPTLYLQLIVFFPDILFFESINILDEDTDEEFGKISIFVHGFSFLFLDFISYNFTVLTFLFVIDFIKFQIWAFVPLLFEGCDELFAGEGLSTFNVFGERFEAAAGTDKVG